MALHVGDSAPYFEGVTQEGNRALSLEDFKGKKLVLFFYPKDQTPGCTLEVKNLRDHYAALKNAGYNLLGVSTDGIESHQRFVQKHQLPFPLLVDQQQQVQKAYFATGQGNRSKRITFLINEAGRISRIIDKVKPSAHAEQILEG